MTAVWITVAVMYVATTALKAIGPVTIGARELSSRAAHVFGLVAPALLAALVVYETLSASTSGIQLDGRLPGIAVAAVAVALRAPMIVVVAAAAITTALARALI